MKAQQEMGTNAKLIRIIRMTMEGTAVTVKISAGITEEFRVNKGLRERDRPHFLTLHLNM